MIRQALLAGLSCALTAAVPAEGTVLRVPKDHGTVQAALSAASPGDTVLVAQGRYTEAILMPAGVILRSSDGPDSTVLVAAGLGASPLEERLVEVAEGADRSTVIEGFTFDAGGFAGTGVFCEKASPVIRGNRFFDFSFGVNVREGSPLIEANEFARCLTFGLLIFASSPEVIRNEFHDCNPRAIEVSGVKSRPVIGGAPGKGNRFYANGYDIVNSSVNDIDATFNDWGWATTAEMEAREWPTDIVSIMDGNDQGKTHRGRGVVDYRNWVTIGADGNPTTGNRWLLPVLIAAGLALVIVVIVRR